MTHTRPSALVTGASSGIGAAFARALAKRGYDLILVARRKDRLVELARELQEAFGVHATVLAADLTDDEDCKRVEEHIAHSDNLELLVNNAGFGTLGRFVRVDLDSQDKMHRLHVLATLRLTHVALRGMVARAKGAIINVSSVAAYAQSPNNVSYNATKAWINSFTEGLYLELKNVRSPVKVQALCPGYTLSEFHDTLGVDRGFVPRSFWMSADQVVAASLSALERDRVFVIPGWRYRLLVSLLRLAPSLIRHRGAMWFRSRVGARRSR